VVTPALPLASSVALTGGFVSITAPRTACPSCGLAGRPSPSAPVQAPPPPFSPFTGGAASAASGSGGFSLFLFGVLFPTLGAALPRWTRRRTESVSGWPAPFIALSVSPD
jgi:hypothetical protein